MRILQVITSLKIGGAEHVVVHLVKLLRQRGHKVDVVVFNGEETSFTDELKAMGCKIFSLGHGFYDLRYIGRLRKVMRDYDIIHTHNSSPQLYAVLANIGIGRLLVTTEHSTNNRKREHPMFASIDKWMYNRYNKIVTISDIAEQQLCEYLGQHALRGLKERILTINNGVDVQYFYDARPLPELEHHDKFVTVMVAGFREAKDQDTVIKAMALLPSEYEFWLVGDGVRRQELEELIKKEQVENRVRLLGIRSDVPNILKSSDVIVMSSHWEGLSLSNIEGMSSGKPFIASEVDGLREVTKNYGLLFPHGDAQALSDIIKRLHDDASFYQFIADRCYLRAQQYDISKMVEQYNQVYQDLVLK
ncbi:MAG: glycosyltransferase [Prevotella sp.]|nr:glycosyltransferase [Prevotella sp.]